MTQAPDSIEALKTLLADLPGPSTTASEKVAAREGNLTKPPGSLGRLEEITAWLAAWQDHAPPRVDNPAVLVFAGNHGVTAKGVSAYPADVTGQMVANFEAGGAAINQLSRAAGATFRVIPITLDHPTTDFSEAPAMTEERFIHAFGIGWTSVPDNADVLALGEMGIGNTTAAAAICHALFGGTAQDWTGPGTGVAGSALETKIRVVADAVAFHRAATSDPLQLFCRLGGLELAAIAGAVLRARFTHIPVVLDGYVCTAAVAALARAQPDVLGHCITAHVSAEPGHRRLMGALGLNPLLDFGMRLGEASGAALAIPLLKAAVTCHTDMATFADAGISDKSDEI